ncbi:hypothetical protein MUN81_07400 [Hymenobacter sp. 5317J-9]|uniref:hypothetical protein n=1 Tax=Hymenobacter sp. 5317J-9 TaxID=2932250 RepID=UPI001FD6E1F5|nr:hypothetical protein [Hymenobacter sp. 5317J-9]UOQ99316.1 hypothetical protein MUN81_07400 [Hymenobacter sp. 5317J-9]
MKILLIVAALLCSTAPAFCQASWTYHVGFVLNDKNGQPLRDDDLKSGAYNVFVCGGGSDSGARTLDYAASLGIFYATGGAIATVVSIGLINGRDTTIVSLPVGSERFILTTWPTTTGKYVINRTGIYEVEMSKARMMYPTWLDGNDTALYSLAILDWGKYRFNQADAIRYSWKQFFKHSKPLKPLVH